MIHEKAPAELLGLNRTDRVGRIDITHVAARVIPHDQLVERLRTSARIRSPSTSGIGSNDW